MEGLRCGSGAMLKLPRRLAYDRVGIARTDFETIGSAELPKQCSQGWTRFHTASGTSAPIARARDSSQSSA